MGVIIKVV